LVPIMPFQCPHRDVTCHRVPGCSKDVFIAISAADSEILRQPIEDVLNEFSLGYYEALKDQTQSGKDAHCVKICGKIIEAPFCISIINKAQESNRGNPNVYYEIGKMNAWSKINIPIAKGPREAEFDMLGQDAIIYSGTEDLRTQLRQRVDTTIRQLGLFPNPTEIKKADPSVLKAFEYLMAVIEKNQSKDGMLQAATTFTRTWALIPNEFLDRLLEFTIKHLDHINEDVSIRMCQLLRYLYTSRLERDITRRKSVQEKALPKIISLIDHQKNGAIRTAAFDTMMEVGNESCIEPYLKKAIAAPTEEYTNCQLENRTYGPFLKQSYLAVITQLYESLENPGMPEDRKTRIRNLIGKLDEVFTR